MVALAVLATGAAVGAMATGSGDGPGSRDAPGSGARPPAAGPTPARPAGAPTGPVALEALRVGRGARGAEILRPEGGTDLPGVIFLRGWGLVDRSDYRPWIRHLARAGNEVIVPRYQRDEQSDPARALSDALAGIRAALRAAPVADRSLVVAGHSAGAALAADYAASAAARRLPPPLAVYAVYPGRAILGYPRGIPEVDPARIPVGTRLVAMAGAADAVVGPAPAQALVRRATRIPPSRKRYRLVRGRSVSDHFAATRSSRMARRTFWDGLDRLIERARR